MVVDKDVHFLVLLINKTLQGMAANAELRSIQDISLFPSAVLTASGSKGISQH